ncbi:MAG TPA: hypothetical protein VFI06_01780 [Chitinophagaceae bacterium]|nr:hypothetical protein [Chitinophagaceae bacterium]
MDKDSHTVSSSRRAQRASAIFMLKVSSTAAFIVGLALFLLPFAQIKIVNFAGINNSGLGIATGSSWKFSSKNTFDKVLNIDFTIDGPKKSPNVFAIMALVFGIAGLIFSVSNTRAARGLAAVAAVLAACCLGGLWFDLTWDFSIDEAGKVARVSAQNGAVSLHLTVWFYISLLAFLAAGLFCYRRIWLHRSHR